MQSARTDGEQSAATERGNFNECDFQRGLCSRIFAAAFATTALACVVGAQEGSPAATSSSQADSAKLEEITVTATRREESIQRVPISITAISQSDLDAAGIKNISDIAATTPGLTFTPGAVISTGTNIGIRGFSTSTGGSVVGLYLDDSPLQGQFQPETLVGNLYPIVFDLNRVEVERGPQGTLFGAGSEAGTVRFITNSPSLTEFSGFSHAEVAYTQDGSPTYEVGAAAGGPIVRGESGFRVSVWDRHDGGYVNLFDPITGSVSIPNSNKDDQLAIRGALAFQLNDNVLITPSVDYQFIHTFNNNGFFIQESNPSTGQFNQGLLFPENVTDHFALPSLKIAAHLPFADLTSTTSYLDRKAAVVDDVSIALADEGLVNYGSPRGPDYLTSQSDVAPQPGTQHEVAITQEVRLASNQADASLTWLVGAFYDHRDQSDWVSVTSAFVDPANPDLGDFFEDAVNEQIAAFAQADYHLAKAWTITLGGREAQLKSNQRFNNGTGVFNTGEPPVIYATAKSTAFTPRGALSYQLNDNQLFYLSAAQGFRGGGGNVQLGKALCPEAQNLPATYGPDSVWNYEIGTKGKYFDGRLQVDGSIFRMDWNKIQQAIGTYCLGQGFVLNAGAAVSKGFDLAVQALVTNDIKVNLAVGYADAYFTKSAYDTAGAPLFLEGDKLSNVQSPWDVDLSANYDIPLPNDTKVLYLRAETQYHSKNPGPFAYQIPTSPTYSPGLVANPATYLTNVRAGVRIQKLDLSLFVNNVFDSHPLLNKTYWAPGANFDYYTTFRPRTVGLSANYGF